MQPRGAHKWAFHLCTFLVCTENGGVSECYTGLKGLEMQHDIDVHYVQKRQNIIYLRAELFLVFVNQTGRKKNTHLFVLL